MWRYHTNRMDARRSQFDLGRESVAAYGSEREPDAWTSMYTHTVSPAHGQWAVATAQAHVMEVSRGSGVCAALCIRRTLWRHVTIGTPMVIFAFLTVFWLFLTNGTLYQSSKTLKIIGVRYQSSKVYQDCTNSVSTVYQSSKTWVSCEKSRKDIRNCSFISLRQVAFVRTHQHVLILFFILILTYFYRQVLHIGTLRLAHVPMQHLPLTRK